MKLSARIAAPAAALVLAGLTATACAPQTSDTSSEGDKKTGTLRVWLFQEVGNKPKQKVVDAAVAAFEKSHEGAEVEVEYIPVDTRAQRIKAAFNDPKSAPDLIEYGNTDTAGYVKDGGLADISKEFAAWDEAKDTDPTAKQSVTVDGSVYGAPLFVGVRALYYRTDVLDELGIEPPKSQAELISTAKKIHKEKPDLYGLAVGGAYTYGAMPFIWAQGGELAEETGVTYRSAINSAKARKGIEAYTSLFGDDNCPAAKCAAMGGNATVTAFASGKAAMAIGGDFSHAAVEAGAVKGKYAVVPLPGVKEGSIAPAFAGGNNIGVLKSSSHRTLAVDLMKSLTGKKTQAEMFDAMGFLPTYTDVLESAAEKEPFVGPFVNTLGAGAKFVPASPAWGQIDASLVLPTMFQEIVSGRKDVAAASDDAAKKMDTAFAEAG
ncbi:ABC transporter substrate-binding protein [Streptomyces sp. FT05W]|uniref:Extracellular solute-binding protein family 1 n=1 Tax=Streptomyces pratensis (strain ATCC 33331 / IAF-45CD) TaxID=591167 RepID=A0A8D4BGT7_STRFA|nr:MULTISPECIES: extracellular solute-binding protein [Streptomyces]MBD2832192.1 extracellular solute-binding protein [Streptomyces pratensis]RAS36114.1 carbohydrate ABC transporter substrate-binding protein (CUT1 family) [Streptomyces avidinii]TPM76637.1 extracellular solute-binding protein [Mesorhizobium sp. B2-3-3]SNX71745.1 carbohydrate ABC transporter substrate-binding protein, CUT1 family [Streptomyces microflavus]MCY1651834.1 extracellular solute-binding protein [Streptomyces sp. SL203]